MLALKYRPKKFEEIIGQEAIVKTLINSLNSKKIANAYLFSGLRGTGKTTTARIFAKSLECEKGISAFACEECESCKLANENRHIDIIEMDAASNRRIEDIRDLIEHTKYKPSLSRFKIFIIDEVHMLTNEAFNALLKTLEEPPEYVKFIMATTEPLKLPPTILSRVLHFRFNKIKEKEIETFLQKVLIKENVPFEEEAIRLIVKASQGSVRDSLTMLDQAIAYSNFNITVDKVVEMLGVVNPEIINEIFSAIFNQDKKKLVSLIKEIKDYDIESIIEEIILFLKDALFNNSFPIITIQRFFNIISDAKELIKYNNDNEFVLSLMLFRMIEATKSYKIDDLIKSLEKNIVDGKALFKKLVKKIKEKDEDLGICFENSIKFISFSNNTIVWESCPTLECKDMLRKFFSPVIRPLINEIFGIGTKIEVKRCPDTFEKKEIKKGIKKEDNKKEKVKRKIMEVFGTNVKIEEF